MPDLDLALAALLYVTAIELRLQPIQFIAQQQKISPVVARNHIHAARVRGFLVGGRGTGRAGGKLSAHAKRILAGKGDAR